MQGTTRAIGVGVAALAASAVIASRGVPRWEARAFEACNDTSKLLTAALWPPMQLGAAAAPSVVAAAMVKRGFPVRRAAGVALAGTAAYVAAKGVKLVVRRGRPPVHVPTAQVRPGGAHGGLGFVSGHAAVAAAAATVAAPMLPVVVRLPVRLLPAVVGLGRVQNGSHLPLDVVGGLGLGLALGAGWRAGSDAVSRLIAR